MMGPSCQPSPLADSPHLPSMLITRPGLHPFGMSASEEFWTVNPATETRLASYPMMDTEFALRQVRRSAEAFTSWRERTVEERCELLLSLAKTLRAMSARCSRTMTHEMGKPIKQSEAEMEKCAWSLEVLAEEAPEWLKEEEVKLDGEKGIVSFEPLGVILGIMPWNFPAWQVVRFAGPALAAGNAVVLRHSNVVPGTALLLQEAFREAGFADGVFNVLITGHHSTEYLIASEDVRGVSFTGSTEAGSRIASLASKYLKKSVLELGGSDPFIVLNDADVPKAAQVGAESRLINSGQSCINAKRFIITEDVYEQFRDAFVKEVQSYIVGDPLDPMTDVGPLVREAALRECESLVRDAVKKGARVLTGGQRRPGRGYFFEPTVLENVSQKMKVMEQEVFGPIAPLVKVKDEEEAIRFANATPFGLGAAIWTRDTERGWRLGRRLEAGAVFVNGLVRSDPRMPFGGVKDSGYGRELSKFGIREFTNVKAMWACRA